MIHVSRTALLIAVVIIALVILLMQRKEGATAAGSGCYRSLGEYDDNAGKYKTSGAGPPLDPKQCNGMEVGYGKDRKCYKSDKTKWKEQKGKSGKCVSWVKKVDWKASPNAKNRFPVYGSYKKSSGKWNATDGGLGDVNSGVTVEECGAKCDANTACTGFTFAKPKGSTKTFDCWLRNNANTDINKKDNTWYSYDKNAGGVTAATGGEPKCAVELWEHGDFVSGTNKCFEDGDVPDLFEWTDKASAIKVKPGYKVDVFDYKEYNTGRAGAAFATIPEGNHVLWNDNIKALTPPKGSNQGWSDQIASMKVKKV